ncbi:unnamed protein product [Prunus armeniaca]|uniref:Uncharacterized protein n=1 Tax=Prunus armeniaca TaxID=36596 RepID=A0A6J5VTW7_PRUAR|nr:unnamed protein product [Prunus armeniaca]
MLKDVFSIRLVNALTRNRIRLRGDETQLDNCTSPPKVVVVVCPCKAMGNGRGETTMREDGLGSDHVLHLFKTRQFSTEGEGHTTIAPMGKRSELPKTMTVEKALVDYVAVEQLLGLPLFSKGKVHIGNRGPLQWEVLE